MPLLTSNVELAQRASLAPSSTIRELLAVTERPGMLSLAGGLPDPSTFPVDALARAAQRVLNTSDPRAAVALQYGPTDGIAQLRDWLAAPGPLHGLAAANADEIVVTTGSQQGIDLIARVLFDPGDAVAVDDPCYLGARQAFVAAGAQLTGIPVDRDGMVVEVLEQRLRSGYRPRVVYTVANFQNPSGAVLSADRRLALVNCAARYGFIVVDDDPYHSLHFGDAPLNSLGNLDPEHVVTLGSLSKVLSPGLRLGWVRSPHQIREAVVRAKQACDLHTSTFTQMIALDLLRDTAFLAPQLEHIRSLYRDRASVLYDAINGAGFACDVPHGGMFLWVRFPGTDTDDLLERAVEHNVAFVPGSAFAVDRQWPEYARLSFATLSPNDLRRATDALVLVAR